MYHDYLMHYGVPGMKWGVRRARKNNYFSKAAKSVARHIHKIIRMLKNFVRKVISSCLILNLRVLTNDLN